MLIMPKMNNHLIVFIEKAFGGLVVGLVTKYAGGVVKGFALIAGEMGVSHFNEYYPCHELNHLQKLHCSYNFTIGLIITGLAQWLIDDKALASKDW
jgi:hypothetical protein